MKGLYVKIAPIPRKRILHSIKYVSQQRANLLSVSRFQASNEQIYCLIAAFQASNEQIYCLIAVFQASSEQIIV